MCRFGLPVQLDDVLQILSVCVLAGNGSAPSSVIVAVARSNEHITGIGFTRDQKVDVHVEEVSEPSQFQGRETTVALEGTGKSIGCHADVLCNLLACPICG